MLERPTASIQAFRADYFFSSAAAPKGTSSGLS
jgi:hypothetical protein